MELCSLPAIYLGPNYGGGSDDNGDLLQKIPCMYCYTQFPQPCSRPPPTHTSAGDSWTLTGKSGSASHGVTAPFSWVLVHKVLFVPSKNLFPSPVVGLMATSSKTAYAVPKSVAPALLTLTSTGDAQTQFCLGLCGVPGSWCRQGLFEPSDHLCLYIYSKCRLASPTILLGLLLCPWTWGILTATPAPTILLAFLRPWTWGIFSRQSSKAQPLLLTLDVRWLLSATRGSSAILLSVDLVIDIPASNRFCIAL